MKKKVLAIYFTQSGQLGNIVDSFSLPFEQAGVQVEKVRIRPRNDYAFPWTSGRFFDVMPESGLSIPTELEAFTFRETSYDLVIFAYQPWYLSPSIPAAAILHHKDFQAIIKDTPVVTLIGARNMWLNAQERVKKMLQASGARLVGNIVLQDRNSNLISAVTILYWMLTGKKDRYLNVFPKPGVAEKDIENAGIFGKVVSSYLQKGDWSGMQSALVRGKAVEVKSDLMFIEARAGRLFSIWANIIIKRKNRSAWLTFFKYYLLVALFIVAPVVVTVNKIIFRPFVLKRISQKKQYYLELN
jgi:hypothetical protein